VSLPVEFPYRVRGGMARGAFAFFLILLVALGGLTYLFFAGAIGAADFTGMRGGKLLFVLPIEAAFVLLFPYAWWRNRRMILRLTDSELRVDNLRGKKVLPVAEIRSVTVMGSGDARFLVVAAGSGREQDISIIPSMLPSAQAFDQVYDALCSHPGLKAAAKGRSATA
jgi:hypothetical protein